MRLRWAGFRSVRRQVCKRIGKRIRDLGLPGTAVYRERLEKDPAEWDVLDSLCHVTISRFRRDRAVFDLLEWEVLPRIAAAAVVRGDQAICCWSAGCASGEEAYTLAILWGLRLAHGFPSLDIRILATDVDGAAIERGREACYRASSLKEIPEDWFAEAFSISGPLYRVEERYRRQVELMRQDMRAAMPDGPFDMILCRNAALTYFDEDIQSEVLRRMGERLLQGGVLVIGTHESLPRNAGGFVPWSGGRGVFVKR